jgi:uncharacterized membrane protein YuzA (DUF378 family)
MDYVYIIVGIGAFFLVASFFDWVYTIQKHTKKQTEIRSATHSNMVMEGLKY